MNEIEVIYQEVVQHSGPRLGSLPSLTPLTEIEGERDYNARGTPAGTALERHV